MWQWALACLVLMLIPGPDMALMLQWTAKQGRRAGLTVYAGGLLGLQVHVAATFAGLTAVIASSEHGLVTLQAVGALYLSWLGVQALRAIRRPSTAGQVQPAAGTGLARAFRQGALSSVTNPKTALFLITFTPQFLPPNPQPHDTAALLGVFLIVSLIFQVTFISAVAAMSWLSRPRAQMLLSAAAATLMLSVAGQMFVEVGEAAAEEWQQAELPTLSELADEVVR